jgi:Fe-S-cluster containining protein
MKEIADFLGLSREDFFWRFATLSGEEIILKDGSRGECTFYEWDSGLCLVYPSRPAQCRTYPFWRSVMATEESWEREGGFCPGIGRGGFHSVEWIERILAGENLPSPEKGNGKPACGEDTL